MLSSAGWPETVPRLCDRPPPSSRRRPRGGLSFVGVDLGSRRPAAGSWATTGRIVFYNDSPRFDYREPDEPVDLRSGVVCSPNNFAYAEPLPEAVVRITALANYDRWAALGRVRPIR